MIWWIVSMHCCVMFPVASRRLIQVSRKCPPTDLSCPFSSLLLLLLPQLLDLIWPVIWILPGLVSPTTSLPGRIDPITPQPQPDQSSLSPRERRFDEQPPPPHRAENRGPDESPE